jgi:hypothetical protein
MVGLGLMLASLGIDGAHMARWMTDLPCVGGAAVLSYILNTTSDLTEMVIIYWYGRLSLDRFSTKRKMARCLLVAVLYSWLLSWRQLRLALSSCERDALVAPVVAGFIALLPELTTYAQATLSRRSEGENPRV